MSAALATALSLAVACGGGDDDDRDAGAEATSTATAAATGTATSAATSAVTATAAATATPSPTVAAGFSATKLPGALMASARVTTLLVGNVTTLRDKATDPQLPFSSVPTMGNTLVAQNVSLIFNSFQTAAAPPAGNPFAFQNTVQGYPSPANATAAFTALRTTWQGTVFQNLVQQATPGMLWQESFCQLGDFISPTSGQRTQWYVCMARSGPYVVTVSVGAFPGLNVTPVAEAIRTYFDEAHRAIQ